MNIINGSNNMRVLLESPYAADTEEGLERNINYARECMRDCFMRGEFPFASHLLYTQDGILDDNIPNERTLGINAGLDWGKLAEKTVVYTDLGVGKGMVYGIKRAIDDCRPIEYRMIYKDD